MTQTDISDRKRKLIFVNIVISCIASSMLATALTTALPPIIGDLNVSVTTGQWLTSGYSLAMAITMPLTAFLIDRFPTKKLYCTAILIFNAGLLISAVSVNFPMMMLGRLVQAAGNGMLSSMAQVIILTIFPPEKKGTAMGWYGLSVGAAPVVAPTIAGMVIDVVGWRMIFIAALAIMIIALINAAFVFENFLDTVKTKFDVLSFVLSAFAFGGITLGIGNIGSCSPSDVRVWLVLIIGAAAAVVFAKRQIGMEKPFLELRILANREYAVSVAGSMLLYFILMGSSILIPLYVQQTMGLSATISGLVMLPGSLVTAVISPFAGRLYDKVGMRILFIVGSICMMVSNLLMGFIDMETSVWTVSGFNVIRSISIACLMMPLVTWGANHVRPEMTAHATALLTSLRTIAGAIGTAVFVAVMTAVAEGSAGEYGENASIHGVNVAFLVMAAVSAVMLLVAIIGTRASHLFRNYPKHAGIFLQADMQSRLDRLERTVGRPAKTEKGEKHLEREDRERARYYNKFTGKRWLDLTEYDMTLDTTHFTEEQAKEIIINFITARFPELKQL